jgi:hypothetical protein
MPHVSSILELVETPLYDTVGLPRANPDAEMPPVQLFTEPIGSQGRDWTGHSRVKSQQDTNLWDPKMLPFPQRFMLRSIRAAFIDVAGGLMTVGPYSRFYRSSILRLQIEQKIYWQGPMFKVADPAVMFLNPDALRGFSLKDRRDVVSSLRHQFHDETSPVIEEKQPFFCTLDFDPLVKWDGVTAPSAVIVLLEGSLLRPIM